jgi:hypothetical protein
MRELFRFRWLAANKNGDSIGIAFFNVRGNAGLPPLAFPLA